ncbi:hypothetical protein WP50_38250, partial [Lactiplantibacillus plantarum]
MGATEQDGELVFLHKVEPGAADKSYGVHVAKLAGMPTSLLERANKILTSLENQTSTVSTTAASIAASDAANSVAPNTAASMPVEAADESQPVESETPVAEAPVAEAGDEQLSLFAEPAVTDAKGEKVLQQLKTLNLMAMTPDDLISGQSTFMVEMQEANNALQHATANSLVLFDEIGRGTATYDGMALAQAIIEFVHNHIHAKTLFSTHYHELTALDQELSGLRNVHVGATEQDGELVFLHKVEPGAADKSYGVHVAKLAGMPTSLLERANKILTSLENQTSTVSTTAASIAASDAANSVAPNTAASMPVEAADESQPVESETPVAEAPVAEAGDEQLSLFAEP